MTQIEFHEIPGPCIKIATYRALDDDGTPISDVDWYYAKLWVQERGLALPTFEKWLKSREYFEAHPEIETDIRDGKMEHTNSIIAFPNPDTMKYSSQINPRPRPGKYPLLIEGSTVEKRGIFKRNYVIDGGQRVELANLPEGSDKIDYMPELGILKEVWLANYKNMLPRRPTQSEKRIWKAVERYGLKIPRHDRTEVRVSTVKGIFNPKMRLVVDIRDNLTSLRDRSFRATKTNM